MRRTRVVVSTRVLGCLSIMLVIFQASSAPVDTVNFVKAPDTSKSFAALPVYTKIGSTVEENYHQAILKGKDLFSNFSCAACRYAVKLLQDMFDSKMSFNAIADAVGEICSLSGAYHKNVCKGVAHTFKVSTLRWLLSVCYTLEFITLWAIQLIITSTVKWNLWLWLMQGG